MALISGTRLGPYEILTPIGAGGMGEVYKAKDTRLDRGLSESFPGHLAASRSKPEPSKRGHMNSARMLTLAMAGGVLTLVASFAVAWYSQTGRSIARMTVTILFRFGCLFIGMAATAYWAAVPGVHPTSQAASAFLLLSYIVSGTPLFVEGVKQ